MKRSSSILLPVLMVCLFVAAGQQNKALLETRTAGGSHAIAPLENAPPSVAFATVVLGGFRGIMTDLLWLRASTLQDEGKYFELMQLSEWITTLEPQSAEVWAFHAWNMTYNISVMMTDYNDRWRWVRNGLRLLRDEGLRYNPNDPELYLEIGWIFQNKIAGQTDRASDFYRKEWAGDMTAVLGGPNPDLQKIIADAEKSSRLAKQYRLDARDMARIDSTYGPLDWRSPDAHSLYWASKAREFATPKTLLQCDRMIYQSMMATCLRGKIEVNAADGTTTTQPDFQIFPKVIAVFEQTASRHGESIIKDAYTSFLLETIRKLHEAGHEDDARLKYDFLRRRFPASDFISYDAMLAPQRQAQ